MLRYFALVIHCEVLLALQFVHGKDGIESELY